MLVNFVCLLACLFYICAIYLKYSKSENSFIFTKYVQNILSWGNLLGATRALADYSLGLIAFCFHSSQWGVTAPRSFGTG